MPEICLKPAIIEGYIKLTKGPNQPHETPRNTPLDHTRHVEDAGLVIFAQKCSVDCLVLII